MRTITINLYDFNELSEVAKQKALEKFNYSTEFFWGDDAIKSLEKFAEHFGSKLKDWNIDWNYVSGSHVKFDTENIEYTVKELKALIVSMGKFDKKTLIGEGECKFTGVCFDEDAADGARKAFFDGERNLNKILQAGFNTWIKSCVSDFENQQSMEYFEEHCEANEYTFEEDGTMNNSKE